jgi:AcrR family transcriptional regulator
MGADGRTAPAPTAGPGSAPRTGTVPGPAAVPAPDAGSGVGPSAGADAESGAGADAGSGAVAPGRDPRRRRALLDAADRIIRREGPEVSMASIAAEAGITKPILYRHFGDKSGLYQALAERHTRLLIDGVRAAFRRPGEMRDRARAAVDTYLAAIAANRHLYGFLVHRAGAEDTATHGAMSTLIRGLGGELAELLLDEGRLRDPVRGHIWGHATVGMVQAAGEWWLDHADVPRGTVVDHIVDLLLAGLSTAGPA